MNKNLEAMVRRGETEIFRDNAGTMFDMREVTDEQLSERIQSLENEWEALYEEKIRYEIILSRRKRGVE